MLACADTKGIAVMVSWSCRVDTQARHWNPCDPYPQFSDAIGMPTSDGYFGFTPFAEQWVGRWAMLGFVSSIVSTPCTPS